MLFVVSQIPQSATGRRRPSLKVQIHREDYSLNFREGAVPTYVACRYVHLDNIGDHATVVPGQRGYEGLTRYLPTDEQAADRLADYLLHAFTQAVHGLKSTDAVRLWDKTLRNLHDRRLETL